jgi:conjugative relaxase-like TrwC/TraI family protein
MLSIYNVGNSDSASQYYEQSDDYYSKGGSPSRWSGLSAHYLGLEGLVDPATFSDLLQGRLPNGVEIHRGGSGRRGGTDLTFSAPKSVSMMVLIGGDDRLMEAHNLAVSRALVFAEKYAACRVTQDGVTEKQTTSNFLVAQFDHHLSRACDPQLHTHCVVINATRRKDGEWRALDNEPLYRIKMLLGAFYRAELARAVQHLGYEIRQTHFDGRFELASFEDSQIRQFSQRSQAIEVWLRENKGLERKDAAAWDKKLVAVITRDRKTNVDKAFLFDDWQSRCHEHSIEYDVPHKNQGGLFVASELGLTTCFNEAIAHISERESIFNRESLWRTMLERGTGIATFDEINCVISTKLQSSELIQVNGQFTTPALQQLERNLLEIEVKGRYSVEPVLNNVDKGFDINLLGLSEGQKNAVKAIALSRNRIIGIQGSAGAGKTTLLRKAKKLAEEKGFKIYGIAPGKGACRELGKSGINSETIAAFQNKRSKGLSEKTILVVDEAGMVSTHQMFAILSEAEKANCRVILVGDTKQLNAVEAGKPFHQLQTNGMHTAKVNQIQRQKNLNLKNAVELAVNGKIALSVELLEKHISEIPTNTERYDKIATDFVALSKSERQKTCVVAGTRYARSEINSRIRAKIGLVGQGIEFKLLERKDLTKVQAKSTLAYEIGDVVMAEINYRSLGMVRGETATVIDRKKDAIILMNESGLAVDWKPALASKLSAFTSRTKELTVGEQVRINANMHEVGLINGDLVIVHAISPEQELITFELQDGRKVSLSSNRPLPMDYGYCSTVYSAQGQTCDRILIEADTQNLTANESTYYVAISRARHEAMIYTDDRESLPMAMSRIFEKSSALSIQPEFEILKNNGLMTHDIFDR